MNINSFILLQLCLLMSASCFSQSGSLPEIERELKLMAEDILYHDSLSYKIEQNKAFASLLSETLRRPESFTYPFDSLRTVSILQAEDETFRIFTWHILDRNVNEFYGEQYHYYFGFVQRKYLAPNGQTEYLVIPLVELPQIPVDVENRILDNRNWYGAQYYPPKLHNGIPKVKITYDTNRQKNGKPIKASQDFYVLLGWNGYDMRSNYKLVELMSFDPEDKMRVRFGADVFYFSPIPTFRGLFKYSENAPFTLNYSYVKTGPFKLFKKDMIVYDHIAKANNEDRASQVMWDYGPDGSYDGLNFYQRRGGYFEWYRNVRIADKFNNKLTRKQLIRIRKEEQAKQRAAGINVTKNR